MKKKKKTEPMDDYDASMVLKIAKGGLSDIDPVSESERIKKIVECPRCAHVYRLIEVYMREFRDSNSKIQKLRWKISFLKNEVAFYKKLNI